ncbi:MAG TPA: hypothetical protein VFF67_02450 [Thermoplasmata archaeon]|nr:hypothetical protein [Thermoplasmata archaeon]
MGEGIAKTSNGYRRRGRLAGYGTIGVAAAAALLMVLSPLAGASVTKTPPFKGTVYVIAPSTSTGGSCKSAALAKALHWVPKTGNVTGWVAAGGKSCTTFFGNGYSSGSAYGNVIVGLPLHFKVNGAHNFSVATSLAATLTDAWTGTPSCPLAVLHSGTYTYSSCYADIAAGTSMVMSIYDKTNNSYLYGNYKNTEVFWNNYSYISNYSSCYSSCSSYNYSYSCSNAYGYNGCVPSGTAISATNTSWLNTGANCGYSYAGHCYYWTNWTLNASHSLWVVLSFSFDAYVYEYGYPAGLVGVASLNAATLGNAGWKVTGLTIA